MGRPTGRPSALTDEVLDTVAKHVRLGLPRKDAAILAGIDRTTYHAWVARGEEARDRSKRSPFLDFLVALDRAEADFKLNCHAAIINAAALPQHWQAAWTLLKARHPEDYARERLEVTGAGGGPIEIRTATVEELVVKVRNLNDERRTLHPEPLALPPAPNGNGAGHNGNGANGHH